MYQIKDYMLLTLSERQKHLDLSTSCIERGGNSTRFQGVLAEGLDTTIPSRKLDGVNVHLCHACHNGNCSNVKHLYWGTPKENYDDNVRAGTAKNPYLASIMKHGKKKTLERLRSHQRKVCTAGGAATKGTKRKSLVDISI